MLARKTKCYGVMEVPASQSHREFTQPGLCLLLAPALQPQCRGDLVEFTLGLCLEDFSSKSIFSKEKRPLGAFVLDHRLAKKLSHPKMCGTGVLKVGHI